MRKKKSFEYAKRSNTRLENIINKMIKNIDRGISGLDDDCWNEKVCGTLEFSDCPPTVKPFVCPYDERILLGGKHLTQPSYGCYRYCKIDKFKEKDKKELILKRFEQNLLNGDYKDTFKNNDLPQILSKEEYEDLTNKRKS